MKEPEKKILKKGTADKFDGLIRLYETTTLRNYRERLFTLESRILRLENRLDDIEHVLMLGRS